MSRLRSIPRAGALVVAVALTATVVGQAASAPSVRVATTTFRTNVAAMTGGGITLPYSQEVSTACRPNERAVAPGIVSATHDLTAQSFGPAAVSSIVVGTRGRAISRLQVLCVKNGKVVNRRVAGRIVPGISGRGFGRITASASCPRGFVASGAPMSQDYAPGFGAFTSTPAGTRGWKVVVHMAPDTLVGSASPGAYADVACIKAAAPTTVVKRGTVGSGGQLRLSATCSTGRALGWGVELGAYTDRLVSSDGRWATPTVTKAAFTSARRMDFRFRLPAGVDPSGGATAQVAVHLVCGKPRS